MFSGLFFRSIHLSTISSFKIVLLPHFTGPGYCQGRAVHGVEMMPRGDMLFIKTTMPKPLSGGTERFTAVQEMKQHCSGLGFISAVVGGLANDDPLAIIDLLGHDGWPAVYGIIQFSIGHSVFKTLLGFQGFQFFSWWLKPENITSALGRKHFLINVKCNHFLREACFWILSF